MAGRAGEAHPRSQRGHPRKQRARQMVRQRAPTPPSIKLSAPRPAPASRGRTSNLVFGFESGRLELRLAFERYRWAHNHRCCPCPFRRGRCRRRSAKQKGQRVARIGACGGLTVKDVVRERHGVKFPLGRRRRRRRR